MRSRSDFDCSFATHDKLGWIRCNLLSIGLHMHHFLNVIFTRNALWNEVEAQTLRREKFGDITIAWSRLIRSKLINALIGKHKKITKGNTSTSSRGDTKHL